MSAGARFGLPLTEQEYRLLELMAMEGLTYQAAGRKLGITRSGAINTGRRVQVKLGAKSLMHAVHIAMSAGTLGVRPSCGTRGGVARHQRYDEEICIKCRIFWRPYRRDVKARARERARSETKISGG